MTSNDGGNGWKKWAYDKLEQFSGWVLGVMALIASLLITTAASNTLRVTLLERDQGEMLRLIQSNQAAIEVNQRSIKMMVEAQSERAVKEAREDGIVSQKLANLEKLLEEMRKNKR